MKWFFDRVCEILDPYPIKTFYSNLKWSPTIPFWRIVTKNCKVIKSAHKWFTTTIEYDDIKYLIPHRTKIGQTKVSKFWLGVENFVRQKILSDEFLSDRVSQKKEKVFKIESFNWLHRSFSLFMQQATETLVIKVMLLLCYFFPKYCKTINCTK